MAGPWEKYAQPDEAPWVKYQPTATTPAPSPAPGDYSSRIFPFTRRGNTIEFDSDAGLLGSIKRAFTLPQEVMTGKVDPKTEEGQGRVLEMGGWLTPINPAVRSGDRAIAGMALNERRAKIPVPTAEELKAAGSAGYKQMRKMGVDYHPEAVATAVQGIGNGLAEKGFSDRTAKDTLAVLRDLANGPKAAPGETVTIPLNGLDIARQELGKISARTDTDGAAAAMAKNLLDGFISAPPEGSVLAGPAAAAGKVLTDARSNYGAAKRSEDLTGIGGAAKFRAAAANSGQNLGNSIRSRVVSALDGEGFKGSTPEEIAALNAIVLGTKAQNATRDLGNLLGGGGGFGALAAGATFGAGAGQLLGGPGGAVIGAAVTPAVGRIAKALSNTLTEKALMRADELTRKRSSLYEALSKSAPMVERSNPNMNEMLVRLLMGAGQPHSQR